MGVHLSQQSADLAALVKEQPLQIAPQ